MNNHKNIHLAAITRTKHQSSQWLLWMSLKPSTVTKNHFYKMGHCKYILSLFVAKFPNLYQSNNQEQSIWNAYYSLDKSLSYNSDKKLFRRKTNTNTHFVQLGDTHHSVKLCSDREKNLPSELLNRKLASIGVDRRLEAMSLLWLCN